MSLVLARCASRNGLPPMEAVLVTSVNDHIDLWQIRRQIYVDEMGLVSPDHPYVTSNGLRDPFDEYSANILLRLGGVPAGSVRVTVAGDGPLEIDQYTEASARSPDPARTAEVTRLMVRQDLRGSHASALLLHAMWRVFRTRCRYLLAAAKPGGLGQYYKNACTVGLTVFPERFFYALTGAQYELILADSGAPISARRAAWRLWIGALAACSFHIPADGMAFVRTGKLPRMRLARFSSPQEIA
ncbi:MAG: hypothetical protein AAFV53_03420 [Myxococcota bacterium]